MARISVRVLRPLHFRGQPHAAGEVLRVEPLDAWQLASSGRAEVADPNDMQAVREALEADTRRALRLERQHPRYGDADPRWIPRF